MRKVFSVLVVLLLCASMVLPAAAAGTFVPSITYKPTPQVSDPMLTAVDGTEQKLSGSCVVVTSIEEARDKTTDITQEERDLLLEVYEKLSNGEMTLPLEEDYIIRELVDVSFAYDGCRTQESHNHKDEKLKEEGTTLTLNFQLKLNKKVELDVLTYIDGEWKRVESVTTNKDGSVTCVFEDICPVVFAVKETVEISPYTGDAAGRNLGLWIGVMAASMVAMVAVVVLGRKKRV